MIRVSVSEAPLMDSMATLTRYIIIRKYGSTFYIGIAMVILAYFGPMRKLKFQF